MNLNQFTQKSVEAVQAAQQMASPYQAAWSGVIPLLVSVKIAIFPSIFVSFVCAWVHPQTVHIAVHIHLLVCLILFAI